MSNVFAQTAYRVSLEPFLEVSFFPVSNGDFEVLVQSSFETKVALDLKGCEITSDTSTEDIYDEECFYTRVIHFKPLPQDGHFSISCDGKALPSITWTHQGGQDFLVTDMMGVEALVSNGFVQDKEYLDKLRKDALTKELFLGAVHATKAGDMDKAEELKWAYLEVSNLDIQTIDEMVHRIVFGTEMGSH